MCVNKKAFQVVCSVSKQQIVYLCQIEMIWSLFFSFFFKSNIRSGSGLIDCDCNMHHHWTACLLYYELILNRFLRKHAFISMIHGFNKHQPPGLM